MTDKPIKEHYEVDSDAGIMVRTFDYISDLEKYCTELEKDWLERISANASLREEIERLKEEALEREDYISELRESIYQPPKP
jgi:ribosomal 50S subunit-associated protein YjgA (DUF615 family)